MSRRARILLTLAAASLPLPATAAGHGPPVNAADTTLGAVASACPGRAINADRVVTGSFGTAQQGSYVMVPFEVPVDTTAVRVKYCYDQPENPISTPLVSVRHTLDLGIYEPLRPGSTYWGTPEFRGWGGSSHPDVTVSPEGFSTEAEFTAVPRVEPPGKTTRAFRPGPIPGGKWAVELGVAAVVPQSQGDADGTVAWRVEIELRGNRAFADEPYQPATYDERPARSRGGWYAGDLHVHAEHSAYNDAPMTEVFDYAFTPLDEGGAGLDFITLSDYVSGSGWGEIGRHQGEYPGKLIARSAEVITYRGHLNNHVSAQVVEYREGPILQRRGDGSLVPLRGRRPAREAFADIHRAGGFTQINHPTIFPSTVPTFALFCRGCPWDYSRDETDYSQVDAIEVATGPSDLEAVPPPLVAGPNPFTATAIQFYEDALSTGAKIAAVGVSDSHNAGRTPNAVLQAPIGEATTMVHAEELSERGIACAVRRGHTYAKVTGNAGPDVRLDAGGPGVQGRPAMMGDTFRDVRANFRARVLRGTGTVLMLVKDGVTIRVEPIPDADHKVRMPSVGFGRYRLQLMRGTAIETVSSPIHFEPGVGTVEREACG